MWLLWTVSTTGRTFGCQSEMTTVRTIVGWSASLGSSWTDTRDHLLHVHSTPTDRHRINTSDVNKDQTHKENDQTHKDKDKDKDKDLLETIFFMSTQYLQTDTELTPVMLTRTKPTRTRTRIKTRPTRTRTRTWPTRTRTRTRTRTYSRPSSSCPLNTYRQTKN